MHFAPDTETTLEFTVALANTVAGATKSGDDEIATEALRNWLRLRGSRPAKLIEIARQIPRSEGPLRTALEYLT